VPRIPLAPRALGPSPVASPQHRGRPPPRKSRARREFRWPVRLAITAIPELTPVSEKPRKIRKTPSPNFSRNPPNFLNPFSIFLHLFSFFLFFLFFSLFSFLFFTSFFPPSSSFGREPGRDPPSGRDRPPPPRATPPRACDLRGPRPPPCATPPAPPAGQRCPLWPTPAAGTAAPLPPQETGDLH
jgi:hypothetical protein